MKTLKVLSALLAYPTPELLRAAGELKAVLRSEAVLSRSNVEAVEALIDDLASLDILEAQERYVLLFDRTRSLSLHLFEHVHGESRDRGQAMVDLLQLYEDAGYVPTASELPDFLPLFLEFASSRPPVEAIDLVGQPGHVLAALAERLGRRQSVYQGVFAALVALSGTALNLAQMEALRSEPDPDPDDLEALDSAWEEEEVIFGPGAASNCGVDSLAAKIRQGRRPAPGLEERGRIRPATVITTPSTARS
ncbi:MAG: nitrate reductase molybdenum cofactor assembly chaperone [Hyphomicrobiaceae bacterium]